jgi:hypothetical protein
MIVMSGRTIVDIHFLLSLFHLLFLAPLLFFVGYQRASTPKWLYLSLLSVGLLVTGYHGYRFAVRWSQSSERAWINLFHLLTIGPLLTYIGYHGANTPRFAYELLLIGAFGMTGYHLFQLVRLLEAHPYLEGEGEKAP